MIEEYEIENMIVNDIARTDERQEWKIDSDSTADWAIEKILEVNAEYARKELVAKNKIMQITEWLKKQEEEKERTKSFFEAKLREYFESLPVKVKKHTKTQTSYKLPSGTLKLKQQGPEFQKDDAKLVEWLKQNKMNDLIKVKESPDWAELKKSVTVAGDKAITAEGEIIDGVAVVNRGDVFSVEVK